MQLTWPRDLRCSLVSGGLKTSNLLNISAFCPVCLFVLQTLNVVGLLGEYCSWEDNGDNTPSATIVGELAVYRRARPSSSVCLYFTYVFLVPRFIYATLSLRQPPL